METGVLVNGTTFDRLYERVNELRVKRGLNSYSREEFEDMFCRERLLCDEEWVQKVKGDVGGKVSVSGEIAVLKATQSSIDEWRSNGYCVVSYDELRKRVDKCRDCVYNKELICINCLGYDTWVYGYIQHIGKDMMSLLVGLKICLVDRAMLVIDVLNKGIKRRGGYCDGCWKVG